jgi:hypothetical protein
MHGPLWLDFPGMSEYIRSTKKKVGAEQSGVASVHTRPYFLQRGLVSSILSPNFHTFKEPKNRFQEINSASVFSLVGRYENPIPTRFLAPIDCFKIPALCACMLK